jgi:DNA-binding NarL/FixJ family response regulator
VEPVRILLADDHPIFREGLRKLLESEPGFSVVGEAASGHDAVRMVFELKPDVLLLDLAMPGLTGLEVLRAIGEGEPNDCRVMVLTASIDRDQTIEALRLGARGVVSKESASALVFKGIREVMKEQYWVGRESVSDLIRYLRQPPPEKPTDRAKFGLTARELQVVAAVVAGYSNKDIAKSYALSADTVKHHLSRAFDKAGVSSRLELALFAINHGLVDRDAAV